MARSILTGIGGAVLSFILLAALVMVWLSWTRPGQMVNDPRILNEKDAAAIVAEYGDPIEQLQKGKEQHELVLFPLISILTGVFVGLLGKVRTGWTAVVALLPLQVFLIFAESFDVAAFLRALAYFLLAYLSASMVRRMRAPVVYNG